MTAPASVRDKALLLQNEVRRLEAGAQGEDQAKRIARRVVEVDTALATLSSHVRAARALQLHTSAIRTLTGLEAGRDDLVRRSAGSIPGDAAFVAARRKIDSRGSELAAEVRDSWAAWTDEQLSSLSPGRIAMLDAGRQAPARTMLRRLRALAATTTVSAPDVSEFAAAFESLKEELDEDGDGPEALLNLADRLSQGAVLLSEVSDEEITLLREYGLDREIELRRKGA